MASIEELKQRIDLHDLAERLGLERPGGRGNYRSPHHKDKSPSLSIFDSGAKWKDHSTDEGGTCLDLVMYVEGCDTATAIVRLHEIYGLPLDRPDASAERREKTRAEFIADRCFERIDPAMEYLTGRGIAEAVAQRAITKGTVGYNEWNSPKIPAGEPGHGGPAVAFITRTMVTGRVVAVDMRYLDPDLNGGVKTQCQGEKNGYPWFSDLNRLKAAHTVFIVESPINALSIETCDIAKAAAVATRGTGNVTNIDWRFLEGKRVIICMDNDAPNERTGLCPGAAAGWKLYELLTAQNQAALLVDQSKWDEWGVSDVNDILKASGAKVLKSALQQFEPWAIAGLSGEQNKGKPRIFLPAHDFAQYWRYRTKEDFTSVITKRGEDPETGQDKIDFEDLAGFRIAALSRVTVASATATMSGEKDSAPRTLFAVSVQAPRHGTKLIRKVFDDDSLHNVEQWRKFGPVFKMSCFSRLLTILERGAHLGERQAANFVGLAWLNEKPIVNQGPDTYFTDPEKQCPYHNLTFPSGSREDARRVISAYQATFKKNAAALPLVWALGGHMKALLGFWPHIIMQASKGAGKSTLIKRIERTLAMTMFSGQSLQTEFRLLTSISGTSHPVGWEEISARKQEVIDKAVSLLQESYQYTVSRRGSDMTEYLIAAPVLLAGEDVPVRSLLGKVIRTELTNKKGPIMPDNLPRFPVLEWISFLAGLDRPLVQTIFEKTRERCAKHCRATAHDEGAKRMVGNYAAVLAAWWLLCEFADIHPDQGDFEICLIEEMNSHISETSADREPWVWILEILLSELSAGLYRHPYKWDEVEGEQCLIIRTSHVMDHLAHNNALRDRWNAMPVKSDRVFKKQLKDADVVVSDTVERTIRGRRESRLTALSIAKLATYGLYAAPEVDTYHG